MKEEPTSTLIKSNYNYLIIEYIQGVHNVRFISLENHPY